MHLSEKDKNGNTPLHWAAKNNSQLAMIYLMSWIKRPKISLRNNQGKTPLHIAVLSSEEIDSGRTLRLLVIKGAQIDVKDLKGRTAQDTVEYVQSERL